MISDLPIGIFSEIQLYSYATAAVATVLTTSVIAAVFVVAAVPARTATYVPHGPSLSEIGMQEKIKHIKLVLCFFFFFFLWIFIYRYGSC